MRVLHLTTEFPPSIWGGLGTAVGGLAIASARAGMTVGVGLITGWNSGSYGALPAIARKAGQRTQDRASANLTVFSLPGRNLADAAITLGRAWRPDVIHLHSFWLWDAAKAVRESIRAPLVYTVHSLDRAEYDLGQGPAECLSQWNTQRDVIERADRVVALTRDEQDLIVGYCPRAQSRVRIVGNGIADRPAARRAVRKQRGGPPVVLFTGRFVHRKGIGDLIAAIPQVLDAAPSTRFVLAGGHRGCTGADMARCWLPAADHHLYRNHVEFTGWLGIADMAEWYQRSDILVVPSWYEPFGMVVLEGMLYGLAVAAADVGGPKEMLEHGRTGILFPPKAPEALAGALLQIILKPSLSRELARAAASEVRRKWLWSQVVRKMRAVYDDALDHRLPCHAFGA